MFEIKMYTKKATVDVTDAKNKSEKTSTYLSEILKAEAEVAQNRTAAEAHK